MDYMNNDMLISASVLSTYWEQKRNDVLDLLIPFLKYSIATTTKENEIVSVNCIANKFKNEFGYCDVPLDVVTTLLNRLSPRVLKKESGDFRLVVSLEKECDEYIRNYQEKKKHQEDVCQALSRYINDNLPGTRCDNKSALDNLFLFFHNKGLFIAKNTTELKEMYSKEGRVDYIIAQFVLEQYKDKSSLFDYLVEMVQGYFVSTALTYQYNSSSNNMKFKKMHCYLDTRIVIKALGLHLPEDVKKCTLEFIRMLKESGAELLCFRHVLAEVKGIISAYRHSLLNHSARSTNTLEYFNVMRYTPEDVDNYLLRIEDHIEKLGIKIVDAPQSGLHYDNDAYIDYAGLLDELKLNMRYGKSSADKAAETDCKSIEAIMLLRNGNKPKSLEKANYIFVSDSFFLQGIVNRFLCDEKERIVPVVISQIELSSWLWIRSYRTHKDFPKDLLLLNATVACEIPTYLFLECLYDKIGKLQNEGVMTAEQAAVFRADLFCRKEIYQKTKGDSDDITEESIWEVYNKWENKLVVDANLETEALKLRLNSEREKNQIAKDRAYELSRQAGEKKFSKVFRIGVAISTVAFFLLSAIIVWVCYIALDISSINELRVKIACGLLAVLDIIGYIQLILVAKGPIRQFIKRIAIREKHRAEDKRKEELLSLFKDEENN